MPDRTHHHRWWHRLLGFRFRGHDRALDELYRQEKQSAAEAGAEPAFGPAPGPGRDAWLQAELDKAAQAEASGGAQAADAEIPWHEKANYGGWKFPKASPAAEARNAVTGRRAAEAGPEQTEAGARPGQQAEAQIADDSGWERFIRQAEAASADGEARRLQAGRHREMELDSRPTDAQWQRQLDEWAEADARAAEEARELEQMAESGRILRELAAEDDAEARAALRGDRDVQALSATGRQRYDELMAEEAEAGLRRQIEAGLAAEEGQMTAEGEITSAASGLSAAGPWGGPISARRAAELGEEEARAQRERAAGIEAEPVMGADYYTARPGSDAHRAAYAEYAEASGGLEGYSTGEAYEIDNAAELAAERWQAEMEAEGDRITEAEAAGRDADPEMPAPRPHTRSGARAAETVARIDQVLAAHGDARRAAECQAEAGDWF